MPSSSSLSLPLQVLAACLTGLLIPLCFTGPAVALPALGAELHGSATALNWVINAYILSYGSAMVAGSLTDVLGRRRVWLAGLALFCVATLAIAHRALRGSMDRRAALRAGPRWRGRIRAAMSSLAPLFHGAARSHV